MDNAYAVLTGSAGGTAGSRSQTYDRIATIEGNGGLGEIAAGTSGQFLKSLGTDGAPVFATLPITQVYSLGFHDDIGTTKHFLPFKDINEASVVYEEEAAFLMPFHGRVKSVSMRPNNITGTGNLTVDISRIDLGLGIFGSSNWSIVESETLAYAPGDGNHCFHFVFDLGKHFNAGQSISIGVQASTDPSNFIRWYVSAVIEFDPAGNLGDSSQEHED